MPSRSFAALLVLAALLVPTAIRAAPAGPAVPETITLPGKVVQGDAASGTVCLDRVPDAPTEVLLFTDNSFAGTEDGGRSTGVCVTCSGRFDVEHGLITQHEAAAPEEREARDEATRNH